MGAVAGEPGLGRAVLPPPGPGWSGTSSPTLEVGQGRAERRRLPGAMPPGAWASSRHVPTHARVAGSPQRGRACLPAAPSRDTPPPTQQQPPRHPTLTTTVMPSFSSGALSYVTSHTRTTVVAPYFFRSWQGGRSRRQRWGFGAQGGDPPRAGLCPLNRTEMPAAVVDVGSVTARGRSVSPDARGTRASAPPPPARQLP